MADKDDKWQRQHTNATQEDIRQARIAERAVTGAAITGASAKIMEHVDDARSASTKAIIAASVETMGYVNDAVAELAKAIAHETDRRDEEDGGLTQRIDDLDGTIGSLGVRVQGLETSSAFDRTREILDTLAKQVAALEKGTAALEGRMVKLEARPHFFRASIGKEV